MMSGATLRLRSIGDYAADFRDIAEMDEDLRVVVGTVAPQRTTEEIEEEISIDPDSDLAYATEETEPTVEQVDDGHAVRFVDWQYPDWAFTGDVTERNPLADADTQFAGTTLFDGETVDEQHHRVLTPVEFHDCVHRYRRRLGAPEEHAVMTGYFSPEGGEYSISAGGSLHRIASTTFPAAVTGGSGAMALHGANSAFGGTVVVSRTVLADETKQLLTGERAEVSGTPDDNVDEGDGVATDGGYSFGVSFGRDDFEDLDTVDAIYPCDLCGQTYPDRGTALACCSATFHGGEPA